MATKTLSVMEDVYDELVRHKKRDESFSDEFMRLMNEKGKISECAGLWSWMQPSEIDNIAKSIKKRRSMGAEAKKEKKLIV